MNKEDDREAISPSLKKTESTIKMPLHQKNILLPKKPAANTPSGWYSISTE
jgi:hypothetical protein